jgi:hypothetical protein
VALVALTEIGDCVFGPLIRLGEQHSPLVSRVHPLPQLLEEGVGLGEVLAHGALPFVQIGDGIEANPVHPCVQPEVESVEHGLVHRRVLVVEVGLM